MAMEQHPIPQNISSYEFRLVGDMTLKQFLQLAGGILVGVIIYQLPLPGFVRFPFVFLSVVIGIALAFVPINGRPFARYIFAFITAIYAPTQYAWRQIEKVNPIPTAQIPSQTPPPISPSIPPLTGTNTTSPSQPQEDSHPIAATAPLQISQSETPETSSQPTQTLFSSLAPKEPVKEPLSPENPITPTSTTQNTPPPPPINTTDQQAIFSSSNVSTSLPSSPTPEIIVPQKTSPIQNSLPATITQLIKPATQANILTGIVATPDGNPVDGAIVEILDSRTGIPARALRTNRTGQFQIATPLSEGEYTIQTEKDNLSFTPVHVEVKGKIIDPIIITTS